MVPSRVLYINDMSEHKMTLKWERGGAEFSYQKYPRDHTWIFDGGHTMTATAAPAYLGNPANVDPEEAFVASLSSCFAIFANPAPTKNSKANSRNQWIRYAGIWKNSFGRVEKNSERKKRK